MWCDKIIIDDVVLNDHYHHHDDGEGGEGVSGEAIGKLISNFMCFPPFNCDKLLYWCIYLPDFCKSIGTFIQDIKKGMPAAYQAPAEMDFSAN